jgi:hypothetical protein
MCTDIYHIRRPLYRIRAAGSIVKGNMFYNIQLER